MRTFRPAPLPSLPTAFSRRAALFGAVLSSGFLMEAAMPLPLPSESDADARLSSLADTMHAAAQVGARTEAFNASHYHEDPDWQGAVDGFYTAAIELRDTPATSPSGIRAKARAMRFPWIHGDAETMADIGSSLAADVLRLHGGLV